jgi:hypothetical protein
MPFKHFILILLLLYVTSSVRALFYSPNLERDVAEHLSMWNTNVPFAQDNLIARMDRSSPTIVLKPHTVAHILSFLNPTEKASFVKIPAALRWRILRSLFKHWYPSTAKYLGQMGTSEYPNDLFYQISSFYSFISTITTTLPTDILETLIVKGEKSIEQINRALWDDTINSLNPLLPFLRPEYIEYNRWEWKRARNNAKMNVDIMKTTVAVLKEFAQKRFEKEEENLS